MAEGENPIEFLKMFERNVSELRNSGEELGADHKLNQISEDDKLNH